MTVNVPLISFAAFFQANSVASSLMSVTDKNKFQNKYRSTMQSLEEHLNTLFLIKASLPGDDGKQILPLLFI
jgi:hypothetical protein